MVTEVKGPQIIDPFVISYPALPKAPLTCAEKTLKAFYESLPEDQVQKAYQWNVDFLLNLCMHGDCIPVDKISQFFKAWPISIGTSLEHNLNILEAAGFIEVDDEGTLYLSEEEHSGTRLAQAYMHPRKFHSP